MGNPEDLAKLKEGVEVWNAWRGETPDIMPDLHGANLCEVDLRGAFLGEADLRGANLLRVKNLSVEQLSKAATLYEAELEPDLMKEIEKNYPHLSEKPKPDE